MTPLSPLSTAWPYPRWIAHRGAGALAPENTLTALRRGARYGYRMFECDVQLSADGVPFLLHDATLERTTNGHGIAAEQPWATLAGLDAGAWHSDPFRGEPLARLDLVARLCASHGLLANLELKPGAGQASRTGEGVARWVRDHWRAAGNATLPLLTSFQPEALAAAQASAPELPRGLLMDTTWSGWESAAQALGVVALVAHHPLWNADLKAQTDAHGWRALSYTVNDDAVAQHLWSLGLDSLITDRVDHFQP